ncbi:hypothetical protein NPX13_g4381 [Xylaria arbuscula]|uniref:Uncharacterized protein n=1 Tax=Xylaria arbuscula TaxID=114810 RepID=A0A9W8NGH1_9PEZI|nr:hypothetical protein NPX13_g4381 [Xylaria arbuscula]
MSSATNSTINLANGYPVYLGLWTNWSNGPILGATFTTSRQNAALAIAFTSTFIGFVAGRVWRSLCFILHRTYSSPVSQDAGYHQIQAILRNAASAEDGLRLSFKLFAMQYKRGKTRQKVVLVLIIGTALLASFTALGGFSALIATSSKEVLVDSEQCGYFDKRLISDGAAYITAITETSIAVSDAENYVQQCYSGTSSHFNCDMYATQQIVGHVDKNAPCPFDSTICLTNDANIRIDSGYINSYTYFGLNAPPEMRILYRNVLHCAPLVTEGFTSQESQPSSNDTIYHYGSFPTPEGRNDYLFRANDLITQYSALSNSYISVVNNGRIDEDSSNFLPISEMIRSDADTTIVTISGNGVVFSEPFTDPWYNVSKVPGIGGLTNLPTADTISYYLPGAPASPLGCIAQDQYCTSNDPINCGPLAGYKDAIAGAITLFNTSYAQFANNTVDTEYGAHFAYLAAGIIDGGGFPLPLSSLGPASLASQRTLSQGIQAGIAPDQWQQDVMKWWNISMAFIQGTFLSSAHGPSDPSLLQTWVNFTNPSFDKVCHNQKMRTANFTSLSVFGLVFTYVVGFLIILISYLPEPIFECLHKRKGYQQFKHLEWTSTATLQLQRLAHEAIGQGTWSNGTMIIPTTKDDELLGLLDIHNIEHPVLRPLVKNEGVGNVQILAQDTNQAANDVTVDDPSRSTSMTIEDAILGTVDHDNSPTASDTHSTIRVASPKRTY